MRILAKGRNERFSLINRSFRFGLKNPILMTAFNKTGLALIPLALKGEGSLVVKIQKPYGSGYSRRNVYLEQF